MNLRTLLIIAGLALPIVAFAILSQSMPMSSKTATVKAPLPPSKSDKKTTENKAAPTDADKPAETVTDAVSQTSADAGQVPDDIKPGDMSAPPVVLPPIAENAAPAEASGAPTPGEQMAGGPSLAEAIEKTKQRLAYLEKMHPSDWPEERKRHKNAPPTLNQAKEFNRNRLAKLATMTPEQWEKEKVEAIENARRQWQQLTPQQQLDNSRNQAGQLPSTTPAPAADQ